MHGPTNEHGLHFCVRINKGLFVYGLMKASGDYRLSTPDAKIHPTWQDPLSSPWQLVRQGQSVQVQHSPPVSIIPKTFVYDGLCLLDFKKKGERMRFIG